MAGRRPIAARPSQRAFVPFVDDPQTQRAISTVADAVSDLQNKRQRDIVTFDLVVGTNKVPHGLGRPCTGYTVTATTANAAFGHAIDTDNPRPDLEVWITVVGGGQTKAIIEIF